MMDTKISSSRDCSVGERTFSPASSARGAREYSNASLEERRIMNGGIFAGDRTQRIRFELQRKEWVYFVPELRSDAHSDWTRRSAPARESAKYTHS